MNTRFLTLGMIFALGLACAGGTETTDVGDDAAVPVPDPSPVPSPDVGRGKRPGRDRDRDRDLPRRNPNGGDPDRGDDRPGRQRGCSIQGLHASSSTDGHESAQVADFDPRTSWCEGDGGAGAGEEVGFTVSSGCTFDRIALLGGNFKDKEALGQYGRPKEIRIYDADRPAEQKQFDLHDPLALPFDKALNQPEILSLPASLSSAKKLTLRIDSVYPGSKHRTACISSIDLE